VLSRAGISENALKVLYRLKDAGYEAYLVGGGVRDLLLGREPKDFDVATDAHPEQIKEVFRNCRLIGRRFRLAHVHFGREIIEVATFRANHSEAEEGGVTEEGRIVRDNVYGTVEDDAVRRDFTINALYYNIKDFSVVDYAGGVADLDAGMLRLIGDPEVRYREDAVRMLRAVRFAAKLGFRIHPEAESPIFELGHLLRDIAPARLYEEVLKLFMGGSAVQTYEMLCHYHLLQYLFPQTADALENDQHGFFHALILRAMENTDSRIAVGKPVTPAFLYAVLMWMPMQHRAKELRREGMTEVQSICEAGGEVLAGQCQSVVFPKRFSLQTREIWQLQPRLKRTTGNGPLRLLGHPRFRASYDFLLLRAEAGETHQELCDWWTEFQVENPDVIAQAASRAVPKKRARRRPRKKPPVSGSGESA
jgi:poly(A) polymerase